MPRRLISASIEECQDCKGRIGFYHCDTCNDDKSVFMEIYVTPESEYLRQREEYEKQERLDRNKKLKSFLINK